MGGRGLKPSVLALVFLSVGCGKSAHTHDDRGWDSAGSGVGGSSPGVGGSSGVGGRGGTGGSAAASGDAGEGGSPDETCNETPPVERRLVRLGDTQIVNSVGALLGQDVARAILDTE